MENERRRTEARASGFGWISVNHYGALVLNANRVFFGDIDCVPDPRKPDKPVLSWKEAFERVQSAAAAHQATFRMYRTYAGLRLLEVSRLHEPEAPETHALLTDLGCDSLYVLLTRRLSNFRVRLSPKPWRAPSEAEFVDVAAAETYLRSSPYAVAHYLGNFGPAAITTPEIQSVANLHDTFCRSDSGLPLA